MWMGALFSVTFISPISLPGDAVSLTTSLSIALLSSAISVRALAAATPWQRKIIYYINRHKQCHLNCMKTIGKQEITNLNTNIRKSM